MAKNYKKIFKTISSLLNDFLTLEKKLDDSISAFIKINGKPIIIPEGQLREEIKYYTSYDIIEIGIDKQVSGCTYIKTNNGVVTAWSLLKVDDKMNIISILYHDGLLVDKR